MKIALVKPDWRIRGGFEGVLARVEGELGRAGHEVRRVELDVPSVPHTPFGIPVPDGAWRAAPEWFSHLALLDAFRGLDLRWADLVVSTQPPSYAVRHPRHLSLFYHHARAFYDLEDLWVRAGRAPEPLHRTAASLLRDAETEDLRQVSHFLAGSQRAAQRLGQFQGGDLSLSLYEAAAPAVPEHGAAASFERVLCVSRHEFTKRTELVVQALALGTLPGTLVGDGGRLDFLRDLAARFATGRADPAALDDAALWLNLGEFLRVDEPAPHPLVTFAGRVSDEDLSEHYRGALCVVAPAYDEDDGLTVFEAMAYGKPVIVCRDGGGLTTHVEDGVNGFVVEPTGAAIAEAVRRLAQDPALARRLGDAGRERALARTPERARGQLLAAVELVGSR